MINWAWIIPAVFVGGMIGFMTAALCSAGK